MVYKGSIRHETVVIDLTACVSTSDINGLTRCHLGTSPWLLSDGVSTIPNSEVTILFHIRPDSTVSASIPYRGLEIGVRCYGRYVVQFRLWIRIHRFHLLLFVQKSVELHKHNPIPVLISCCLVAMRAFFIRGTPHACTKPHSGTLRQHTLHQSASLMTSYMINRVLKPKSSYISSNTSTSKPPLRNMLPP